MRNRANLVIALVVVLFTPLLAHAAQRSAFDAHDLGGIWLRQGGEDGLSTMPPAFTPDGAEAAKMNIPAIRSRTAAIHAADRADGSNDPALQCNPKGFPRILLDAVDQYQEMVVLPNRIIQLWQEERRPREIWLDGRKVPAGQDLDDLGPGWYGHSVGRWEGDTLVVTTVGLDDRAWVDSFGFPKSPDARVEERYKRIDPDTLQVQVTLVDPTYYANPWVSDAKIWKKQPADKTTWYGWQGVFSGAGERICAPMNRARITSRSR